MVVNSQHQQPRTSTLVRIQRAELVVNNGMGAVLHGIQEAALAVMGQYPSGDPGSCIGSHGSVPQWGSRKLHRQSWASIPVGIQEAALAVKNQYPCGDPGSCIGSQESVPLWGSRKLHWQSRTSTPVGIQEAALAVKNQYPCGDPGSCTGSHGSVPWCPVYVNFILVSSLCKKKL